MATEAHIPDHLGAIEADIAALKAKHDRLPVHYTDMRAMLMAQIETLIDEWLDARGR